MALSNMRREPRRELTESAVGFITFGIFMVPDCLFAHWFATEVTPAPYAAGFALGCVLGLLGVALVALFIGAVLSLTHVLVEGVCNALEARGVHLRPRNRPTRA